MKSIVWTLLLNVGIASLFFGCNTRPEPVFPAVNSSTLQNISEYFRADVDGKAWVASGNFTKTLNSADSSVTITGTADDISISIGYNLRNGVTGSPTVSLVKSGSTYSPLTVTVDNLSPAPYLNVTYSPSNYFQYNSGAFSFLVFNIDGNFVRVSNGAFYLKF